MKTNALAVRQSFGKILQKLKASGEPIVIEKGREEVAVLISIEDYRERFIDRQAEAEKQALLERFKKNKITSSKNSTSVLHQFRYEK